MDDLKRRIIGFLDNDSYRITGHFHQRCRERNVTVEDAIKALRNGIPDLTHSEISPRFGESHAFIGKDHKDRTIRVVVGFTDDEDHLVFITVVT